MTTRKIEQATTGTSVALRTMRTLDTALQWPSGTALSHWRGSAVPETSEHAGRDSAGRGSEDVRALRIGRHVLAIVAELHAEFGRVPG